jgi:cytochrome c
MTSSLNVFAFFLALSLWGCGEHSPPKKDQVKSQKKTEKSAKQSAGASVNLESKGVGPIKHLPLAVDIDASMATEGEALFKKMCTACHKVGKKFIGPDVTAVLKRRSPEWVMNMILNPAGMVQEDPVAKKLLMEFNGAPMANQSLSEQEARTILEYFRTLN